MLLKHAIERTTALDTFAIHCVITHLNRYPPLSGHAGISRPTRLGTIPYKSEHRSWGRQRRSHKKVSSPCYITRSPTKRTTLVGSLVLIVKLGARYGRRLAPPRYEYTHTVHKCALNKHIPLIFFKNIKKVRHYFVNYSPIETFLI